MAFSQTASVTRGCSPLTVNFSADSLTEYYWEFEEGNATSVLQNPEHIFTHPGIYTVKLYEGKGNDKIAEINIKVYEDPIIKIFADTTHGCVPLSVNFSSEIILDPELSIIGYKWAFGDGEQSNEEDPNHVFSIRGAFDVSLEIMVDLTECNKVFTEEKMIRTSDLFIDFLPSKSFICDHSGKIYITNITTNKTGNTYHWDFGNGTTSNDYNPKDSIFYTEDGVYTIVLTVTTEEKCIYTKEKVISVGKPTIDLDIPKVGCIYEYYLGEFNDPVIIKNNTVADTFIWDFSPFPEHGFSHDGTIIIDEDTVYKQEVKLYYQSGGYKGVFFRAYANEQCYSDTSFTIFIEDPQISFMIDPLISCLDPIDIKLTTRDSNFAQYFWSFNVLDTFDINTLSTIFTYDDPPKDSLLWNHNIPLPFNLLGVTENGCKATYYQTYVERKPNAHFAPDIAQGCAPLTVTFSDSTDSREPVVWWKYIYGNGDSTILFTNEDHSYTFEEPGDYYVKLIIENDSGCIDTSAGEWIRVGEPIAPEYELDKTEICLGDSVKVTFNNNDPRIDSYHLETDDGRFNQCWKSKTATHVFKTDPGEYPVIASTEYNGCYVLDSVSYTIKVNGAKADLGYSFECNNQKNVHLKDKSINASNLIWAIDSIYINDKKDFEYTFDKKGVHKIVLEALDSISGCPSTFDSVEIMITNLKADIELPRKICDSVYFTVNAGNSIDVASDCAQGYTWYLPDRRPVETSVDSIQLLLPSGNHNITLVVKDVNGCKDTISKPISVYGIDLDFTLDHDAFCVPATIKVNNMTTSDTTIVSWQWKNGPNEKEPTFVIPESYLYDYYNFELWVTDEFGCRDTGFIQLHRYDPETKIILDPGNNLCVGDELTFSATDYTEQGSHLNFNWELIGIDSFDQQMNSVIMDKRGIYPLILHFEEESSGCSADSMTTIHVVDYPVADFYTDTDSLESLCYPQIITFTDSSDIDGPGYVRWIFKDVVLSHSTNDTQVIEFPKGTHEATLIARSFYGCSDTISKSFTIVGPEADVAVDKSVICIGDTIEFTLINPVDVSNFEWDFGDGTTLSDINPIKHVFDRAISTTDAKVIIKNSDSGCEASIDIPLEVNEVIANFDKLDTSVFCTGYAYIKNLSIGADKYIWETPSGEIQTSDDPVFILYPSAGIYDITLTAINTSNKCKDIITKSIELEEFNSVYIVPNIFTPNGDGENDFFRPVIINEDFKGYIKFNTFKIYNRWGNLIYDNSDPSQGWNGMFDNQPAPAGVYGYYLEADISGCEIIKEQGNFTLIR